MQDFLLFWVILAAFLMIGQPLFEFLIYWKYRNQDERQWLDQRNDSIMEDELPKYTPEPSHLDGIVLEQVAVSIDPPPPVYTTINR